MKKRRVAILLNDMNAAGGIQRVAANLTRDLSQKYDTMLLSVEPLQNPVFFSDDLEFNSLEFSRRAQTRQAFIYELFRAGKRLRQYVIEKKIDTVLAIWYDWAVVAALALPRHVKTIGCEHIDFAEASRSWQWIRRYAYPRLDAVVGLTQDAYPSLEKISRSAYVIPNSVSMPSTSSDNNREKILLTVGHLISRKGIDRLLWALKGPLHSHPDWKLAIVGGGEKSHIDWGYMDYLATLINILQLNNRVNFYPATEKIDEWYKRASLYVMGSRQEGLPMVLLEAKAHGLPIVCFDCPTGPKDIVRNGIDGFLIQNCSNEFGDAAETLMSDGQLWQEMSKAALKDVKDRFSSEAITEKWYGLIELLHQEKNAVAFNG